jgi:nucleotide-binding universal stress UspA family protein
MPLSGGAVASGKAFRVLVASDGSIQARRATSAAAEFPWPEPTRVRAVVARRSGAEYHRSILLAALDRSADLAAGVARRALTRRWPDADVTIVDQTPADGVLAEAERFGAKVIVVGWRGHGRTRRLLMGSVSHAIARRAMSPVLVVRRRPVAFSRMVLGLDGSATANRAVLFVASLRPAREGAVTLMTVVEPMGVPSQALVPATVRASVAADVQRINADRIRTAKAQQERAAAKLRGRGWRVKMVVTLGEPLRELLAAAGSARAHVVVVGARGGSRVRQLLLGSVADGVLNHCPATVLVVR